MQPQLIILDEPFSALDPKHAGMIDDILERLSDTGITEVIATHNADRAWGCAQRVVILNESKILADGSPEDIFSDEDLLQKANLEPPTLMKVCRSLKRQAYSPTAPSPKQQPSWTHFLKSDKPLPLVFFTQSIYNKNISNIFAGGVFMKGFSITGFILGIVSAAAGITALVFSIIGFAKSKDKEF